jgi:hypothetical protein
MGYHIINITNNKLKHDYAETYEELAYFDSINVNSIIYEGEEHWTPERVGDSDKYFCFSEGWYRSGIQAQEIFKQQATENGYMLEELSQDRKSFKSYVSNANSTSIKRGDFLVRNRGNIEIDVKCRGFRIENGESELHFDFKCEDVDKHLNMASFTKTPVLIAVYENKNDTPVDSDLYMFDIKNLLTNKEIKKKLRQWGDCYRIPLSFTNKGFKLIDFTYNGDKVDNEKKSKKYSVEEKRLIDTNAYRKWTKEDDDELEVMYCDGKSINELSVHFGRNGGGIRSRIKKLELEQKYGG